MPPDETGTGEGANPAPPSTDPRDPKVIAAELDAKAAELAALKDKAAKDDTGQIARASESTMHAVIEQMRELAEELRMSRGLPPTPTTVTVSKEPASWSEKWLGL